MTASKRDDSRGYDPEQQQALQDAAGPIPSRSSRRQSTPMERQALDVYQCEFRMIQWPGERDVEE